MPREASLSERRQPFTLHAGTVILVGLGTAAFLAAAMTGIFFYDRWMGASPDIRPPTAFPAPRLQSDPAGELEAFQAAQRQALDGYGWVDQGQGLVRIPIERAMALLAARGEQALDPLGPPPSTPLPVRPEAARHQDAGR
jgi:hypothetical protein